MHLVKAGSLGAGQVLNQQLFYLQHWLYKNLPGLFIVRHKYANALNPPDMLAPNEGHACANTGQHHPLQRALTKGNRTVPCARLTPNKIRIFNFIHNKALKP